MLHGMPVLRFLPTRRFGLVAISTSFAADEGEGQWRAGRAKRFGQRQSAIRDEQQAKATERDEYDCREQNNPASLWRARESGVGAVVPSV